MGYCCDRLDHASFGGMLKELITIKAIELCKKILMGHFSRSWENSERNIYYKGQVQEISVGNDINNWDRDQSYDILAKYVADY